MIAEEAVVLTGASGRIALVTAPDVPTCDTAACGG